MRTTSILATAAAFFATSAFAAPTATADADADAYRLDGCPGGLGRWGNNNGRPGEPKCMSDADADVTADVFRQLIQGYTKEMAVAALTEDFVDYSSAVSIIMNKGGSGPKDLVAPIFTSRAQFMEGHGKQQIIPFETLAVWHNCNGTVSMRWKTTRSGQGQKTESAAIPVVGTAILETVPAEEGNAYNYRIKTLYSEFNTAAWLVNNGVFKPAADVTVQPVPAGKRDVRADAVSAMEVEHWSDVYII